MAQDRTIPRIPRLATRPLGVLPKAPLQIVLRRVGARVVDRQPKMFARLGQFAENSFLIAPTDLPFAFLMRPSDRDRLITIVDPNAPVEADSRISGALAALLGLVHGRYDGDGLFFSRDLSIEGDMEAVLALRNALDDAELDLFTEFASCFGAPGAAARRALRRPVAAIASMTGVALIRSEESR